MTNREASRDTAAFTLIELLVVLGIIGVLFGLTLGAVQNARSVAARISCQSNLRQIGVAIQNYESTNGAYPMQFSPLFKSNVQSLVLLLPYVEQESLWQETIVACQLERFSYLDPPHIVGHAVVNVYCCPSDWRLAEAKTSGVGPRVGLSSYLTVSPPKGKEGILTRRRMTRPGDVSDGLSNTLIMGERPPPNSFNAGWWYSGWIRPEWITSVGPNGWLSVDYDPKDDPFCSNCFGNGHINNESDRHHFWSLHPGGANFLFGDGSLRFLSYTAAPRMPALASIAGGEPVEPDQ